jgi:hypothetical protein
MTVIAAARGRQVGLHGIGDFRGDPDAVASLARVMDFDMFASEP